MKEIKLNTDSSTFTKAETKIMSKAKAVNAPIAVALRQNNQSWKLGPMGQTHRPKKQFVDLRTNQKISIGAARQILAKFEKQFAFSAKHEAMHQQFAFNAKHEAMHQMFQHVKAVRMREES